MKIVYIHQYFTTPEHSGGTRSYEIARRLVRRGHQVRMITTSAFLGESARKNRGWNCFEIDGIEVEALRLSYSNSLGFLGRLKAFVWFMAAASFRGVSHPTDLVFATSTPLTIAISGMFVSTLRRAPMVFEVRDLWPSVPIAMGVLENSVLIWLARFLERSAYWHSSAIVALSPGMLAGVRSIVGDSVPTVLVPNSCDIDLFRLDHSGAGGAGRWRKLAGGRRFLAYAGSLGPLHGADFLVEVAGELKARGSEIVILCAGDGRDRRKLEDRARWLGILGKEIIFLGPLPKVEVADLFREAEMIFNTVMPGIPELQAASPNKFFDALAAGRPVASTMTGWIHTLISEAGCGINLPAEDPKEAARLIEAGFFNEPEILEMRESARRLAETEFSRDKLVSELAELLESVASRCS